MTPTGIVLRTAGRTELCTKSGGLALRVADVTVLRCVAPVAITVWANGVAREVTAGYTEVSRHSSRLICSGQVRAAGTEFRVEDTFTWTWAGLRLAREVSVHARGDGADQQVGFASALRWTPGRDHSADLQWFLPGCVYRRNEHAPPYAIGAQLGRGPVYVRADRLALPVAACYDPATGTVAALLHEPAAADTVRADDTAELLISAGFRVGSFGDLTAGELGFSYPGGEGGVSYPPMYTAGIGNSQADSPVNPFPPLDERGRYGTPQERAAARAPVGGWARRYHPLRGGAGHHYELITMVSSAESFTEFVRTVWRCAWAMFRPWPRYADTAAVERVSLNLLAGSVVRDAVPSDSPGGPGGVGPVGIPTWTDVFTGRPGRLQNSFSIGFVGRNLEAAYVLLRAARRHGQPGWDKLARELIGFWVRPGGGLSHTEWDRAGQRWVDSGQDGVVYLRDQSEARTAVLAAVRWLRSQGEDRQDWLDWCIAYGRWLLSHVGVDGSLCRSYRLDGTAVDTSVNDGIHAAAFLARLTGATGDRSYLATAMSIADFYWAAHHATGTFTGGTLDNPNCYDREAASLAMDAYLAVYAATGDPRWLDAARVAADFCESWIVGWDIPMHAADAASQPFFDRSASASGLALITLGFSAVDTYLARHVGDFLRLAEATGDDHYGEVAALMLHNSKQMVQLDTEYGYAAPGYQIEHWSIGRGRGYGLNSGWLPWVATSHVLSIWAAEG